MLSGVAWVDDDKDGIPGRRRERAHWRRVDDAVGCKRRNTEHDDDCAGRQLLLLLLSRGHLLVSETQPSGYGSSTPNVLNVFVPTRACPTKTLARREQHCGGRVL